MAFTGVGFLKTVGDKIRLWADEPADSANFSDDTDIAGWIRTAWAEIVGEVNRGSSIRIRSRVDIVVVADQQEYSLPANIGQFLTWEKITTDGSGRPETEVIPLSPLNPSGPGFMMEGPKLRLDPIWRVGETMRLTYVPSAEIPIFEATATTYDSTDGLTITAPASVTDGTRSTLEHAYVGYVIRNLAQTAASFTEQIRVCSAYVNTTGVLTFTPAWSPIPAQGGSDTITFEVVPQHIYRFEDVIAYRVCGIIHSIRGDDDRSVLMGREYAKALRSIRLDLAQLEQRRGKKFERAVRGRRRSGLSWGAIS